MSWGAWCLFGGIVLTVMTVFAIGLLKPPAVRWFVLPALVCLTGAWWLCGARPGEPRRAAFAARLIRIQLLVSVAMCVWATTTPVLTWGMRRNVGVLLGLQVFTVAWKTEQIGILLRDKARPATRRVSLLVPLAAAGLVYSVGALAQGVAAPAMKTRYVVFITFVVLIYWFLIRFTVMFGALLSTVCRNASARANSSRYPMTAAIGPP